MEAFYSHPGLCYPKRLIYPPEGGEYQLEQLRGALPRYQPVFPAQDGAGDDMEMTMAQPGHITLHLPVGALCAQGWQQLAAGDENSGAQPKMAKSRMGRRPLRELEGVKTAEEELEKLCGEKQVAYQQPVLDHGEDKRCEDDLEDVDRQLEQLALDCPPLGLGQSKTGTETLEDQENQPAGGVAFKFTPSTLQGGCNWPTVGEG